MSKKTLMERCKANTNIDADTFVGINAAHGEITVNFPLGFGLSQNEKELRREILLLLNVLAKNTEKKESEVNTKQNDNCVNLPIQAYLYIIADYYSRGYYKETESDYFVSKRGKVNWGKTVKTQRAFIQDEDIYYLDFVTKKNNVNENEIITLIHEACVYESFKKIGWLFTAFMPPKPRINIRNRRKYCMAIVKKRIADTFNDRNRQLLKNVLAVVASLGDEGSANEFRYGTYRFEYIWESMIDKAYGINSKEKYFPKTRWVLPEKEHENAALEPDTIMMRGDTVYVLDAKYYKYGWSGVEGHLPESTSINKQITYGEYIAESEEFRKINNIDNNPVVYNAFIMPYDSYGKTFHTEKELHYIGSAISDWKSSDGTRPYEDVVGILLDVKSLMENHSHSEDRIINLASLIEESVEKNRRRFIDKR